MKENIEIKNDEVLNVGEKEKKRVSFREEVKDFLESPEKKALVKIFRDYKEITTF